MDTSLAVVLTTDALSTEDDPKDRTAPVLCVDESAFSTWVSRAAPGARLVYFRGHLAFDRMPSVSPLTPDERQKLVAVAKRALRSADEGIILLVQRRHGPQDYEYIAIKAQRRQPVRRVPAAARARR